LKSDKFIDEERYANAFVNDAYKFNKWGRMKIRQALAQKGISRKFTEAAIANIDEDEYLSLLKSLVEAKSRTLKQDDEYKRKAALFRFVASRGFEIELVEKVIG
ncbi:MAG: RecX family transcriptional regulator, partial [Bacteroidales bacterium]|nr:RecX family transcriptional regulator [Bacteroidales bacterium]